MESIIAAAISRIGKQVLHLDFHEFYGENWASFNLDNIESWVESLQQNSVKKPVSIKDFNSLISGDERISNISRKMDIANASINEFVYRNIDVEHVEEVEVIKENIDVIYANETQEMKIQKKMRQLSKRFNLDLCPKVGNIV